MTSVEQLPGGAEFVRTWSSGLFAIRADALQSVRSRLQAGEIIVRQPDLAMKPNPDRMLRTARVSGHTIAIIPLTGPLTDRDNFVARMFGMTSYDATSALFQAALTHTGVDGILFWIDSPGGVVSGLAGLCDDIFSARGQKPMLAYCDSMACSAAYWIASQCDAIVLCDGQAQVGSVGAIFVHADLSEAMKKAGLGVTVFSSSAEKKAGNPYEPLSDPARENIQAMVDGAAAAFRAGVLRGRKKMLDKDLTGRVHSGSSALTTGYADAIERMHMSLLSDWLPGHPEPKKETEMNVQPLPAPNPSGVTNPPNAPTPGAPDSVAAALAAERARYAQIESMAGTDPARVQIARAAIANGLSAGDAAIQLCQHDAQRQTLSPQSPMVAHNHLGVPPVQPAGQPVASQPQIPAIAYTPLPAGVSPAGIPPVALPASVQPDGQMGTAMRKTLGEVIAMGAAQLMIQNPSLNHNDAFYEAAGAHGDALKRVLMEAS